MTGLQREEELQEEQHRATGWTMMLLPSVQTMCTKEATSSLTKTLFSQFPEFFHSAEVVYEKKKDHTNVRCIACYSTIGSYTV